MTRIGLAQIRSRPHAAEANRSAGIDAAAALFAQGADIVVLPEMTVPWYSTDRGALEPLAEPLDGATVAAWHEQAQRHNGIVIGGLCERGGASNEASDSENDAAIGAVYNSAVAVDSSGVIAHYRKLHLFDTEKHCFAPGDAGLGTVETVHGSIGLCICYDLRFVEVVRLLALRGADLICVPTAWVRGFDRRQYREGELIAHAEGALIQANLSQVFIACVSQVGAGDGVEMLGSSVVADPYGRTVGGPLSTQHEKLAVCDIDLSEARRAQARSELITPRSDRRTDVYGLLHDGEVL
ncbi:MAG: hypothetical protein OXE79_05880 [Acidimicrobiaceae bacterium]|nr:hypothetical protein [Acidimicrobiaceae bacterium]MCY4176272.1 hypothetical protein [Acidimicrobiaceae bacterium]MCY4280250.1 hypothetical protein [Acidimicrobiaceae bacterium]MCY4293568.1 hypothetical protein [Acidimicrobiaceae bacterium]